MLRRGGLDAELGRWREMTLVPWSFREHVQLQGLTSWTFALQDALEAVETPEERDAVLRRHVPPPLVETERLESALVDYPIRGGFPEAATAADPSEARRRLRQDILGRDHRYSFAPSSGGTVRFTQRLPAAAWLFGQRAAAGGTLRLRPG